MYRHVIVKTPCHAVTEGITTQPELGKPDYELAMRQHADYVAALRKCGVSVTVAPPDEDFPDSVFVEDAAVMTDKCAIITNPGAPSRNGEPRALLPVLQSFHQNIEAIHFPGTLEGGDVMAVGDRFFVGLSDRTNAQGIAQLGAILAKYGYSCIPVPLEHALHLKTGVNFLGDNNLLVSGEFVNKPQFDGFNKIVVPELESYAANCLWVNGTVIVPEGFPAVQAAVEKEGYPVLTVDTSEFQKIDGGLSCLSLRF